MSATAAWVVLGLALMGGFGSAGLAFAMTVGETWLLGVTAAVLSMIAATAALLVLLVRAERMLACRR
jgi:hypothetical protein